MSLLDVLIHNVLQRINVSNRRLEVPGVDNGNNVLMRDVVGNKSDANASNTLYAKINDLWEGMHHSQLVYPTLAAPVTVTAAGGAWTLGNFAEIVPANTITTDFHIHHLCICEASVNGGYEAVLYAAEVEIGRVTFTRTDKKDDVEGLPIMVPHSLANAQIQAKVACSVAGATVKLKLWYHSH